MFVVFSYNREAMLSDVLETLKDEHVVIIDDGSPFEIDHENFIKFPHGGKPEFWRRWEFALSVCKKSKFNRFVFMPDDFLEIDVTRIKKLFEEFERRPFVYNIINDNRPTCWNNIKPKPFNSDTLRVGFTDCGFFCNRKALSSIGFNIQPIPLSRFKTKGVSSGVGFQLTKRFLKASVPIYKPVKSLAFHGEHVSQMHKSERLKNPIVSK